MIGKTNFTLALRGGEGTIKFIEASGTSRNVTFPHGFKDYRDIKFFSVLNIHPSIYTNTVIYIKYSVIDEETTALIETYKNFEFTVLYENICTVVIGTNDISITLHGIYSFYEDVQLDCIIVGN